MSRACFICGKKSISGHNVSHSHHKTKRKWQVNLQLSKIVVNRKEEKVKLCTKCIKKQNQ